MTTIHDIVPHTRSRNRNAQLGRNKATGSVKNGRKLANESVDKNALSLAIVRLADEFGIYQLDDRLVISTLRASYGLSRTSMSRWEDVGVKVRLSAATSAMNKTGKRVTPFTVVFSDRIQQTLMRKADAKEGVSSYVQKKLREGFKAAGIPVSEQVYWFTLEAKSDEKPYAPPYYHYHYHVHGVMLEPVNFSKQELEAALNKVGGKDKHFDNQVDTGVLWFDIGWLSYTTKQMAELQAHTGDKCYGLSGECKRLSRMFYLELKGHVDP